MRADPKAATGAHTRPPVSGRCPICGNVRGRDGRGPFCSPRCQLVDLERWLDGRYRIPIDERNSGEVPDGPLNSED